MRAASLLLSVAPSPWSTPKKTPCMARSVGSRWSSIGLKKSYMDTTPFAKIFVGVLGQIGCSFISGLLCRSVPAGPDGIR